MVVVLVQLPVKQIQYRDFHHALIEVCGSVLDYLDCNHLLSLQVLTFDNLTKGTLAENIKDEVSVFVSIFFIT